METTSAARRERERGRVDLSHEGEGYAKVEAEEGATPAGRFRFHLTPVGGGTRAFEAPSAEARDEWVKALAKAGKIGSGDHYWIITCYPGSRLPAFCCRFVFSCCFLAS